MRTPRVGAALLAVTWILAGVPARAEVKIGVVDYARVLSESKAIQKMNQDLQAKIQAEQKVIAEREKALKEKKQALDKQGGLLDESVRADKEEALRQELKDLQRYVSDKDEQFKRKSADLMKQVMEALNGIVSEIGEAEGYTLILERSSGGVIYAPGATDLTPRVVREYDKRHAGGK